MFSVTGIVRYDFGPSTSITSLVVNGFGTEGDARRAEMRLQEAYNKGKSWAISTCIVEVPDYEMTMAQETTMSVPGDDELNSRLKAVIDRERRPGGWINELEKRFSL